MVGRMAASASVSVGSLPTFANPSFKLRNLTHAVELNFAAMPGGNDDRYFYDASGQRLGTLDALLDRRDTDRISLVDECAT